MTSICKRALTGIALALGLLVSAATAQAGFTARFDEVTPGVGSAGVYQFQVTKAEHDAGSNSHFVYASGLTNNDIGSSHYTDVYLLRGFCIQFNPVQYISSNQLVTFDVKPLANGPVGGASSPLGMGTTAAANLRMLWAQYGSATNLTTNEKAAAFQYAVWHVIGQFDGAGLTGAILTNYNTYINSDNWKSGSANLVALTNPDTQDYVVEVQNGFTPHGDGLNPVPAPAALVLALAGIAPCLALRRRLRGQVA